MSKSEREFVEWLRLRYAADAARVPLGIGDDMAEIRAPAGTVLVTADMLMDGVDFRTSQHWPRQIGRKALACGLSDCAAMAVRPVAAIVSVALPNTWSMGQAQELYLGIESLAREMDVAIAGGDTNSWDHPLVIDVTVMAEPWADASPVRRSGAVAGDRLYVSGRLGGSLLGRHMTFSPRVALAHELRRRFGDRLHAMLDISDGVSVDLSRLCSASGVGAELFADRLLLVASADAERASSIDGRSVVDHVLNDGEDFELLLALDDPSEAAHLATLQDGEDVWIACVGRVVPEGLALLDGEGRRESLEPRGWEHFTDRAGANEG